MLTMGTEVVKPPNNAEVAHGTERCPTNTGVVMAANTRSLVAFAHVADVERSAGFYSGLGFSIANSVVPEGRSSPVWVWLTSEKANLMLGLASGPIDASQQAILFYLYYDDIKQTRSALTGLGYACGEIKYPFYMPGGEFRMEDPDGYVLMLAQI